MLIEVVIDEDKIRSGIIADCWHCPGAKAINEHIKRPYLVGLFDGGIYIYNAPKYASFLYICKMPNILKDFVSGFDKRQDVRPIAFTIEIPDMYLKDKNDR